MLQGIKIKLFSVRKKLNKNSSYVMFSINNNKLIIAVYCEFHRYINIRLMTTVSLYCSTFLRENKSNET